MSKALLLTFDLEMLGRLLLASVLGMTIGLERELKRKPLGLKTSLVISIISCLLTIVSIQSSYIFPASENAEIRMDPLRLAAQIVSGVGFLGAGVILRRDDDRITGLTTAAIVWGAAGIGIATGAGFYIEAITGVVLLMVSVELLPAMIQRLGVRKLRMKEMTLRLMIPQRDEIQKTIATIEDHHIRVKHVRIKDLKDGSFGVTLRIRVNEKRRTEDIYQELSLLPHIHNLEISGKN
ncbi:MAG TPA: MgtC/SapB family protein [Bacillota bacterium]|nr:MgtC/SapB family protein [Bacillota bacterium]